MLGQMENLGQRRYFALSGAPPALFAAKSGSKGAEVPVFQPFEEDLPLQSGYYTFVIDADGRFRVRWGKTSSHAAMVNGGRVASAGSFRIGRMGQLAEVFCQSYNYRLRFRDQGDRVVRYTLNAFVGHPAFGASEHSVFTFTRGLADRFVVDRNGNPIDEPERRRKLDLLDAEGYGGASPAAFVRRQVASFVRYGPPSPPRLYPIKNDHAITVLEEDGELRPAPGGEPCPRYAPDHPIMPTGKVNFILDDEGWLILGMRHHHILSGGREVGGAGHLIIDASGAVAEMQLNFSGHYRPLLSAEYARYAYRALRGHPLLTFVPIPEVKGRKFDEETFGSSLIRFEAEELERDDPEFEEKLERLLV